MNPEDEKQTSAPDPAAHSRLFRWLDNFWYHYKWHTILSAFALVTLIVCLVQCSSRESTDLTVCYAGGFGLSAQGQQTFADAVAEALPEDFNGDGSASVTPASFSTYTEKELSAYIETGECMLWFVSPALFESCGFDRIAVPLTELFEGGSLPAGKANDWAIALSGTEFYRSHEQLAEILPSDTLIVFTKPFLLGKSADQTAYENSRRTYYAIVNYQASAGDESAS